MYPSLPPSICACFMCVCMRACVCAFVTYPPVFIQHSPIPHTIKSSKAVLKGVLKDDFKVLKTMFLKSSEMFLKVSIGTTRRPLSALKRRLEVCAGGRTHF